MKNSIVLLIALLTLIFSVTSYANTEHSKMVNVLITFKVKENKLTSFREIMTQVKTFLPTVEGCKDVKIYNDKIDLLVFTLVETWESEELHKNHIAGVKASGDWDNISQHLQHRPESSYFNEI